MASAETLVLAGHGSQRHPRSAAPLHSLADRIRERELFRDVRVAFWKEEPSLRNVASTIATNVGIVVPVLTSEGYFADEVFPRELGIDESTECGGSTDLRYADPVGTHDDMASVVEARVESVRVGQVEDLGVAVVGHGTERNERSGEATEAHAERIRERNSYGEVDALFLDESPHVREVLDRLDAPELVVVPLFVADGYHTTHDIPAAIDHPGIGRTATIEGRTVHYTGAVGTEPSLADVVVERAIEASTDRLTDPPGLEANAIDQSDAARAFVDWIDETGSSREWGELSIGRTTDGYALRHRDDIDSARDALEFLDDPTDLREHVRHDDGGRYRPLSGAPTLPTGWALAGLDEFALVRAVRSVYPASIAHWRQARTGVLDVTDFHESAARQTGIYADLDEIDEVVLSMATEAVCGRCVRDRQWRTERDEVIDPAPREGAIPCREACPLFLSATHAFRELDGGVATLPDPEVPVGALEEPGNEYRVRFLRALDSQRDSEPVPLPTGDGC